MVGTLASDQADWDIRLAQADAEFLEIAFAFDHREVHLLAALDVGDDWVGAGELGDGELRCRRSPNFWRSSDVWCPSRPSPTPVHFPPNASRLFFTVTGRFKPRFPCFIACSTPV
jgi:hypothetical protein